MSYSLYITRAESWLEDSSPITLSEIESIINPLPFGFYIDRSGIVSAATPNGKTLTAAVGDYLVYDEKDHPENRIHIYFDCGLPPYFRLSHPKQLAPVIDLAEKLGAQVQGEELEIYTKDNIPKLSREWDKCKKKSSLQKLKMKAKKMFGKA